MNWNAALYDGEHAFVSRYGKDIISLLGPQAGEQILDLGCGTGDLTACIAETGANVFGIDSSEEMLLSARKKFPHLHFQKMAAEQMDFHEKFNAVFSNAVMHWISDQKLVAENICRALTRNGRLVLEFGGKNCNRLIFQTLEEEVARAGFSPSETFHFRSVGEYATILEQAGFTVEYACLFDRDTLLAGEDGMMNFLKMFGCFILKNVPPMHHQVIYERTVLRLHKVCWRNGGWHADYVRLRMRATKK